MTDGLQLVFSFDSNGVRGSKPARPLGPYTVAPDGTVLYPVVNRHELSGIGWTKILVADYALTAAHSWWVNTSGYVIARGPRSVELALAVAIAKPAPGLEVDHRNRDPLDNRRTNLRCATRSQNAANRSRPVGSSAPYRGVRRTRNGRRWMALLSVNGRQRYFGTYDSPELAARAYDVAALEQFGEFAALNNVSIVGDTPIADITSIIDSAKRRGRAA